MKHLRRFSDSLSIETRFAESLYSYDFKKSPHSIQGTITTSHDYKILTVNDTQCHVLGYSEDQLQEKSILDLFTPFYRSKYQSLFTGNHENEVIVSGNIIRMQKSNGNEIAFTLWLKQKHTADNSTFYIWIFEEVDQLLTRFKLKKDTVLSSSGGEAFGYTDSEIVGTPIGELIPKLSNPIDFATMNNLKYFVGRSKKGTTFPIVVKCDAERSTPTTLSDLELEALVNITSMPNIAGVIVLEQTGRIFSINNVFAKYLFGRTARSIIENMTITDLIPEFYKLMDDEEILPLELENWERAANFAKQNWKIPQSPLDTFPSHRRSTMTTNDHMLNLPGSLHEKNIFDKGISMLAKHRDGMMVHISVTVRECQGSIAGYYLAWISFNHHEYLDCRLQESPVCEDDSMQKTPSMDLIMPTRDKLPKEAVIKPYNFFETLSLFQPTDSISDYRIMQDIGEGAYGFVKLAYNKHDPQHDLVVIKYVVKSKVLCWCRRPDLGGRTPVEAAVLYDLVEHPHSAIPKLLTCFQDDFYFYLIMPYTPVEDLFYYIENNPIIPEKTIQKIFRDIAIGVKHLHNIGIVHRDIKDENIIIDKSENIKLIDFGSSVKESAGPFNTFYGTVEFCAPEVLEGQPYTGKPQDMWSLGILLYTLIYHNNPFCNVDEILSGNLNPPFELSQDATLVLQGLLQRDLATRWDIDTLLDHPWLKF